LVFVSINHDYSLRNGLTLHFSRSTITETQPAGDDMKYTNGPWIVRGKEVGPKIVSDDQSHGMMMAVAYIEQFDYPESHEANAKLISAAPDMLEALKEALPELRGLALFSDVAAELVIKFEAAIKKAGG